MEAASHAVSESTSDEANEESLVLFFGVLYLEL